MIKAISGGQTGCDLGSLDAALACGFPTGGTMPWRFTNENGAHSPAWAKKYNFTQTREPRDSAGWSQIYRERTAANVNDSDVTIWFEWNEQPKSPGFWCTYNACKKAGRGIIVRRRIGSDLYPDVEREGLLYACQSFETINFAGGRESKNPGIYEWVYGLLVDVFTELKKGQA